MRLLPFKERLLEVIDNRINCIALGQVQDYATYRENVGYIRGLKEALAIAEAIEEGRD